MRFEFRILQVFATALVSTAFLLPVTAYAQSGASMLEEVITTARKRRIASRYAACGKRIR